jgi:hypothetical protein
MAVSERCLFCCGLRTDLEPDTRSGQEYLEYPAKKRRGNVPRGTASEANLAETCPGLPNGPRIETSAFFLTVMNDLSFEEKTSTGINVS